VVDLLVPFPLIFLICTVVGLSLVPGVYLGTHLWQYDSVMLKAISFPVGFYLYGFSLMILNPIFCFFLGARLKPYRGPSVSFRCLPWYIQAALHFTARYSFLEFITPTIFSNFYFRAMGMKVGKNVYINSTRISDPSMIEMDDGATIGGSANVMAHYASGSLLVIEKVRIGKRALVGHGATIFGGVEIGDKAKVLPNSFVLPKTKIPPGETWGGIPASKVNLQKPEQTEQLEQPE
jgi:acetyltransferase-like isoleucine patch superfamily enzyme